MNTSVETSLYDRDFNLWLVETINKLRARQFDELDLDHLIDEVEGLAGRDKRELISRLRVLISHLLKRGYVSAPNDFRGWEITIRDQRNELQTLLEQSPSLKRYVLENLNQVWQKALHAVQEDYPTVDFPEACPFPADVEALLAEKFWQQ